MFFEPSTNTIHPTIQHYAAAHPEAAGLDTEAGRLAAGLHRLYEPAELSNTYQEDNHAR